MTTPSVPVVIRQDDPAVTNLHRFLARRCDGAVKMRINRFDFA